MSAADLLDQFADDAHDWEDAECSSEVEEASARLRARHQARVGAMPWSNQGLYASGRAWPQGMPTPCDLAETPEQTIARLVKRVNFLEAELNRSTRP